MDPNTGCLKHPCGIKVCPNTGLPACSCKAFTSGATNGSNTLCQKKENASCTTKQNSSNGCDDPTKPCKHDGLGNNTCHTYQTGLDVAAKQCPQGTTDHVYHTNDTAAGKCRCKFGSYTCQHSKYDIRCIEANSAGKCAYPFITHNQCLEQTNQKANASKEGSFCPAEHFECKPIDTKPQPPTCSCKAYADGASKGSDTLCQKKETAMCMN